MSWKTSKLSKLDYTVLFTGVVAVGMIFSLVSKQGKQQQERMYKNKEIDTGKAHVKTKAEKAKSDKWIENLEKTHKENKEK